MLETIVNSHILLMKVGPYCGYSLEEIIKIKHKEIINCGKFFWGYGGVFCQPKSINSFVAHALTNKAKPLVLLTTTPSAYQTATQDRFKYYSTDKLKWPELPKKVLLVGNKNKPHFAIVATNLKKVSQKLDLSQYCTFAGMLPDPNKRLDNYFKYRVDKACGYYQPSHHPKKEIMISYTAELIEPHCVYIK